MIPFLRELAWQFAQIDDDDHYNKDQNREHDKSECIQQAKGRIHNVAL
jgi:hypothetical protein